MRILYLDIFGIWTMYQCNPIIIPYTDSRIIRSWQRYIPVCQCLLHMDCDWCSIYHFQHGAKQYPKNRRISSPVNGRINYWFHCKYHLWPNLYLLIKLIPYIVQIPKISRYRMRMFSFRGQQEPPWQQFLEISLQIFIMYMRWWRNQRDWHVLHPIWRSQEEGSEIS